MPPKHLDFTGKERLTMEKTAKMTWKKITQGTLQELYDVLAKFWNAGIFPEGTNSENFIRMTAGAQLDLAQRVADDEALWSALPERIIPSDAKIRRVVRNMQELARICKKPIGGTWLSEEEIIAEQQEGISRDGLRKHLQQILNQYR